MPSTTSCDAHLTHRLIEHLRAPDYANHQHLSSEKHSIDLHRDRQLRIPRVTYRQGESSQPSKLLLLRGEDWPLSFLFRSMFAPSHIHLRTGLTPKSTAPTFYSSSPVIVPLQLAYSTAQHSLQPPGSPRKPRNLGTVCLVPQVIMAGQIPIKEAEEEKDQLAEKQRPK